MKHQEKIGIFFVVDHELLTSTVSVRNGEFLGVAVQFGGHLAFWEKYSPNSPAGRAFKMGPYNTYPRARIVYYPNDREYVIYADPCLISDSIIRRIEDAFGLQKAKVVSDERYQCAECNPLFLK